MTEQRVPDQISAKRHMAHGTSWMFALRWAVRLTGLISTIVLARWLTPADYGVVAIAALILGTIEVLAEAGQANAIIRHPNPTREHYDSAWTISLLFGFGLALIVLAATPLTVVYFHEPRAKLVLEILALRTALSGLQNIGTVNFQRNLQFHRQFYLNIGSTATQFVAVLTSAFVLRNYWALVIGILSKQISLVCLSYIMESYRPRICWAKIPELFSFSFWTLFRNIGSYVQNQVDKIAIGGFAGAAAMGRYDVGRDLAASPVTEANGPMNYVLFSVMAKIQNDSEKRRGLFLNVLYWSALICTATSVGVALVADDMVDVVLGPKWDAVKPLVPWLALSYGVGGLTSITYVALESIGRPGISARLQWMRVIGMSLLTFPAAFYFRDLKVVAMTHFLVSVLVSPTLFYALSRALEVPMRDFTQVLWRPFAAGIGMAITVMAANATIASAGTLRLALDVGLGAVTFAASLMVLWILSGRPAGPETVVWTQARKWFAIIMGRLESVRF